MSIHKPSFSGAFKMFLFLPVLVSGIVACGGGGSSSGDGDTEDTTAPVIVILGDNPDVVLLNAAYSDPGATATDDVDGVVSVSVSGSVDTSTEGAYELTYSAADSSGNNANAVRTVNVVTEDNEAPVITLNGAVSIDHEQGTVYNDAGASATDNVDGDLTGDISVSGSVNVNVAGVYQINYDVSDSSDNAAITVTRSVTVADRTAPVITLIGVSPMAHVLGDVFTDPGATASDNIDGPISVSVTGTVDVNTEGAYELRYSATDSAGNNTVETRTVNVTGSDTEAPVISILGDNPDWLFVGNTFSDSGATATDNVDGSVSVSVSDDIDNTTAGAYSVTYRASDAAGNNAQEVRTVNVIEPRAANTSCIPPDVTPGEIGDVSITAAFPSLPTLANPLAMVQPPADSSFWLAALRSGQVVSFDNEASASSIDVELDIRSKVSTEWEAGMTGIAIHPNYPSDNRVFIVYNDSTQGARSTVSSFSINTSTRQLDASSETVLFTVAQPFTTHNGGDMAFGRDGYLYVGFGDGGGTNPNESQDRSNLLGTMVRIDVSTSPYTVPADNPFNTGQDRCLTGTQLQAGQSICPEIFAYGFRNPWRWSFDSETGDLWLADVGEDTFEEVNKVVSGGNYGWPIMEAIRCSSGGSCDQTGLELPITHYPRSVGVSTVGGYVYRGTESPSLVGQYIWGDTFSSQFLSIPASSGTGSDYTEIFNSGRIIAGMAQGNDGEVYLLNLNGEAGDGVYRVVADGSGGSVEMPAQLSAVGCFNTSTKTSAPGVVDYRINSTLWSDSALKTRSFAIPDGEQIGVQSDGDFDFPTDTVLIKHFLNGDVYLETRLFINHSTGWAGYSYEWNDAQTDATLLSEGKTEDVGDFVHTYPSQSQCNICHTSAANFSLGIENIQLNLPDEGTGINQLDRISQTGYLSPTVDSAEELELFALDDTSASLEQRARSYLHSNCSGCHRPGAAASFMDLRFSASFDDTNTCNVAASAGNLGVPGAMRISPGNADASVMVLRMETLGSNRMPPLATLIEDEAATQLMRDWVNSMTGCD